MSYAQAGKTLIRIGFEAFKRFGGVAAGKSAIQKYAPPQYRKGLYKVAQIGEALLVGKGAYEIYSLYAPDTPGNDLGFSQTSKYVPKTYPQYKARGRYPRRPACRHYYKQYNRRSR